MNSSSTFGPFIFIYCFDKTLLHVFRACLELKGFSGLKSICKEN